MDEQRLFLDRPARRPPFGSPRNKDRAAGAAQSWDALRASLIGESRLFLGRRDHIDVDIAMRELRRAEPTLASWKACESRAAEPRSPEAIWTLAVLLWATTTLLVGSLIGAAAFLLGRA